MKAIAENAEKVISDAMEIAKEAASTVTNGVTSVVTDTKELLTSTVSTLGGVGDAMKDVLSDNSGTIKEMAESQIDYYSTLTQSAGTTISSMTAGLTLLTNELTSMTTQIVNAIGDISI